MEDIALAVTLLRNGVYDSRFYIIGLTDGNLTILFESEQQNSLEQDFAIVGDMISYRVAIKTVFDVRSTYSAIDEFVVGFDRAAGTMTIGARRLVPYCVDGVIDTIGEFAGPTRTTAAKHAITTIRLGCNNALGSSIYSVTKETSIKGASLRDLGLGRHVEVSSFRFVDGELIADEMRLLP